MSSVLKLSSDPYKQAKKVDVGKCNVELLSKLNSGLQ